MRKVVNIKTIIGITIAFIFGLGYLYEIFDLKINPDDYINVYIIEPASPHWMFRSVSNYLTIDIIKAMICFVYISLSIQLFNKRSRILIITLTIFEIIIVFLIIRYCLIWQSSGFDHYPGFDPYIF